MQWCGSQRCPGGFLVVGLCAASVAKYASAAADCVSRQTGAGACSERDDTEVQCDGSDERRKVMNATSSKVVNGEVNFFVIKLEKKLDKV